MDRNAAKAPSALALAFALALAACQAPEDTGKDPVEDPSALQVRQVDRRAGDSLSRASDYFHLDSALATGDSLILHVSTGGGCREHVYTLYSGNYILLSSPSGVETWLHHESNDDPCDAMLYHRLAFGLEDIPGLDPEGYIWQHSHPDDSLSPLNVWLPRPPLRYPLRFLSPAGADSLAAGSDPLEVAGHRLDGDTLRIEARYGGGCREHVFTPYVSTVAAFSNPPQYTVWIRHDAAGDPCKAYLSAELALDVGELVREFPQPPRFQVLPLSSLR